MRHAVACGSKLSRMAVIASRKRSGLWSRSSTQGITKHDWVLMSRTGISGIYQNCTRMTKNRNSTTTSLKKRLIFHSKRKQTTIVHSVSWEMTLPNPTKTLYGGNPYTYLLLAPKTKRITVDYALQTEIVFYTPSQASTIRWRMNWEGKI